MSKDLNLCQFIGRLGKDPEIRYTASGSAVANLSIACGDDYKDKNSGEKVEQTNWIRIVAFNRLAEIIGEYLKKGSQVHISGKQVTRKWQNKEGVDQYTTEIVASEMQMLGARSESQPANASSSDQRQASGTSSDYANEAGGKAHRQTEPEFDEDVPF